MNPNELPIAADGNEAAGDPNVGPSTDRPANPVGASDRRPARPAQPESTGGLASTGVGRRGALRGVLDLLLD